MEERMIPIEWVESTVSEPALRTADPNDPEVERFFRRILERGDRVLRVCGQHPSCPLARGERIL